PAAGVRDERECGKHEAELGPEGEHAARHGLNVVLAAGDDEGGDLVGDQPAIVDGELVLNAVEPLGHLEIEGRCAAPADGRGDEHDVRPVHQSLVHGGQLVG